MKKVFVVFQSSRNCRYSGVVFRVRIYLSFWSSVLFWGNRNETDTGPVCTADVRPLAPPDDLLCNYGDWGLVIYLWVMCVWHMLCILFVSSRITVNKNSVSLVFVRLTSQLHWPNFVHIAPDGLLPDNDCEPRSLCCFRWSSFLVIEDGHEKLIFGGTLVLRQTKTG